MVPACHLFGIVPDAGNKPLSLWYRLSLQMESRSSSQLRKDTWDVPRNLEYKLSRKGHAAGLFAKEEHDLNKGSCLIPKEFAQFGTVAKLARQRALREITGAVFSC